MFNKMDFQNKYVKIEIHNNKYNVHSLYFTRPQRFTTCFCLKID